jgi:hypothetical protein
MATGGGPTENGGQVPRNDDSGVQRGGRNALNRRIYNKDHTVRIDVLDNTRMKANCVIDAIERKAGVGSVFACVPKSGNLFEITAADNITADLLLDGISIAGTVFECSEISQPRRKPVTVSIMHLPAYIEDDVIVSVFNDFDSEIEVVGSIRRHYYKGTSIADGTRIVTLKLPPTRKSLPYTMKFPFEDRKEYYRVIHDNQVKLCRVCYSDEHLMEFCPSFLCYKCGLQGHLARKCVTLACAHCHRFGVKCTCKVCDKCKEIQTECSCENNQTQSGQDVHQLDRAVDEPRGSRCVTCCVDKENCVCSDSDGRRCNQCGGDDCDCMDTADELIDESDQSHDNTQGSQEVIASPRETSDCDLCDQWDCDNACKRANLSEESTTSSTTASGPADQAKSAEKHVEDSDSTACTSRVGKDRDMTMVPKGDNVTLSQTLKRRKQSVTNVNCAKFKKKTPPKLLNYLQLMIDEH